jgi:polysaccharide export outer membrane protein
MEKMRVVAARAVLVAALNACLLACAARELSPPPVDPEPMERETYVIGVTDLLAVNVWKNEELSVQVPVRSDGMISVPLIHDVQAEGLTPEELRDVVGQELGEYVTAPQVTVIVVQTNSRYVSLIGEVARPQRVPLSQNMRVLEAIAFVGGFNTFANRGDIRIVRRDAQGGEQEYRFDYRAYIRGKAPGTNIVLRPGDTIIVPD